MKRMNLRDVPDDVYAVLASAAAERSQSLSAFVVEQLTEIAKIVTVGDYLAAYTPPASTGATVQDAVAAVRAVREAS
ncbi:MAG: hypothetical protein ACRC35_00155 [Angustibacter sp.]